MTNHNGHILVRRTTLEQKSDGGFKENYKDQDNRIAFGKVIHGDDTFKKNDVVIFEAFMAIPIHIDGETLLSISTENIRHSI